MDKSILKKMAEHCWAILPSALETAVASVEAGLPVEAAAKRPMSRAGAVAIVPLQGVLRQKGSTFMDELFGDGGGSTERFAANIRRLAADESIGTIVLDVHSPGGEVFGTQEAADAVWEARQSKKVVAVINSLGASAAYWIASQAHEIIASPSSLTGSIGIIAIHQELSKAAEMAGVGITIMSAGKLKAEINDFEPLTDEAKAGIQHQLDEYYAQFVAAVARGRKVSQASVKAGFGQGRVLTSKDAVSAGLADRIGTMRDVIGGLGASPEGMAAMAVDRGRICACGHDEAAHDGQEFACFAGMTSEGSSDKPGCECTLFAEAGDPAAQHQREREKWRYAELGSR